MSLYPSIVASKARSENQYTRRLTQLSCFLFWSGLAISAFFYIFGDFLISQLYGQSYSESTDVLRVYSWVVVFGFMGAVSNRYILTENINSILFVKSFLGAILNVGLNYYLIPKFGVVGAAYSTIVSFSFVFVLYFLFDPRLYKYCKILFSSIILPLRIFR
jgi:O-antigen/teichoic acid export membrane protein